MAERGWLGRRKKDQLDYLLGHFRISDSVKDALLRDKSTGSLSEADRSALLKEVADRLQKSGFDAEYQPTDEGRLLEGLIDAFAA